MFRVVISRSNAMVHTQFNLQVKLKGNLAEVLQDLASNKSHLSAPLVLTATVSEYSSVLLFLFSFVSQLSQMEMTLMYYFSHHTANACLFPVCALHRVSVTTVEGIGNTKSRLHPAQVSS